MGKSFYKLPSVLGKIHSEEKGIEAAGILVTTEFFLRADALSLPPLPAQRKKKRQKRKLSSCVAMDMIQQCGCHQKSTCLQFLRKQVEAERGNSQGLPRCGHSICFPWTEHPRASGERTKTEACLQSADLECPQQEV